jgi:hypothetical protein
MSIANKLVTIAENVNKVYEAGKEAGGGEFYDKGYGDGYEIGKTTEREAFWNAFTNKKDFDYAFYNFQGDAFYPTCNISPTSMMRTFYMFNNNKEPIDLIARCKECGIVLDFSKTTYIGYCFANANGVLTVPIVNLTSIPSTRTIDAVFNNSHNIKVIEKIVLKEDGTQKFSSNCFNCNALEEIRFEGAIGTDISFQNCPLLSKESLLNILSVLKDISGTNTTQTLTLGTTNLAKLTDEEKAIATEKGWSLA